MRRLYRSFRRETEGRPFLVLLGVIYAVIPVVLGAVAVYSVFQRDALNAEINRNCERSAAIADYIRDAVPPTAKGPAVEKLLALEMKLRSIGACGPK